MKIGYIRASRNTCNLELQKEAFKELNCEKIFIDAASGVREKRESLESALAFLRQGDVLVIWRLDRMGLNLSNLVRVISKLVKRGIDLISITEGIDTRGDKGKVFLETIGYFSDFQKNLIEERPISNLQARARGKNGGRKTKVSPEEISIIVAMYHDQKYRIDEICKQFDISKPTLYRYINKNSEKD